MLATPGISNSFHSLTSIVRLIIPTAAMIIPVSDVGALAATAKRTIKAGDLVVVYEGFSSMKYVTIDPKGQFNNRYATFLQKVSVQVWVQSRRLAAALLLFLPQFPIKHIHSSRSFSLLFTTKCWIDRCVQIDARCSRVCAVLLGQSH